ncbi:protoporphyrinogen oxidase [Streptomyces sp. H27-D2]|uniref:protoporphyrinogen oxidase n=1 Tax=Streptomyces sp. H27-D2 TaxID=3046304 RepID=UPI002DB6C5F4|nr:protoporphyrinogen oxidase [Streptomyces sp. H27-D2]MEC4019965.1 protoporphyrinogen oxidase [Streptomyces sp. H27-D2]
MSATDTRTGRTGHVVVIGGGISGLAAAHRLLGGGARVTVLEASQRLGGKLIAGEIAGFPVEVGAESMLARRPEAVVLARAVGLGERLQPPATASAMLWTRGSLRPMPKGHLMGVPGDLGPLAASGVISDEGLARIARDADLPRTEVGEDVAVGEYIAARLGREVVDRLVEPLLGGVYAGNAYRISMRAAVPQLFEAARAERSLLDGVRGVQRRAAEAVEAQREAELKAGPELSDARPDAERSAPGQPRPVFNGIVGGVGTLPLAVADACRAAGAEIRTGTAVRALTRTARGWRIVTGRGADENAIEADAVVLAVPAPVAARLLADEAPAAASELAAVDYASMALVTMAFRRGGVANLPVSSGFLVPPVDGRTIKASTFASRKWGWIGDADPDLFVLRTSIGRFGEEADLKREDAELVGMSLRDLGAAVGLAAVPVASRVTRWDEGLPQYPVGHLGRVERVRERVAALPGLRVCGAVYEGVGIPACIASARRAADELLVTLPSGAPDEAGQ